MKLQHPEVRFEPTNKCNATCIMCPREKQTREQGFMDRSQYKNSIDEIVLLGAQRVVLTSFGEPMLDKGLEEKIAYAKTRGLKTYIITNGSALTEERAYSLLQAGLDEMRVSFYGMQPETYNAVMQGLDYDKAVKNILTFLSVRKTLQIDCKIMLSFLVMPENGLDMAAFRAFWEPLVDYIEIWKPHNWSDGRDYREKTGVKRSCGRPENGPLQIQWNGDVIPCCYDYNNSMVLGNAFNEPIEQILNGEKYNDLREDHQYGHFDRFPFCNECDQLLEHKDALIYSNRHNLSNEEAVKLSNTDLYNLVDGA